MTSRARRRTAYCAVAVLALLTASCGGADNDDDDSSGGNDSVSEIDKLKPTTPAAKGEADRLTWALYRETNSLDPIYAFDYPENTVVTALCDSLLQQQPDGSSEPGLAELSRPDEKTVVLKLRDDVTFWDGSPLTADDVVYSLQRNADVELGGFYTQTFDRVEAIEATGPSEVTITLTEPDYWLDGELSSMAGVVVSKKSVEASGANYGTPAGETMCTGPFKLEKWATGDRISVVRNDAYWGDKAMTKAIDFVGVPDEAALTAGLLSGDIDGTYGVPQTLDQLEADPSLTVRRGPSYASGALVISSLEGTLGDLEVRKALSMAIDREGLIDASVRGNALLPRTIANPGTWGYGKDVFRKAWDQRKDPVTDVDKAKEMVEKAGATGKTITLAGSNEIPLVATSTNAVKSAAEAIGLKVELQTLSAANFINLFIDPAAREGVDGFVTLNYPDYADPAALYATFVIEDGSQNFAAYEDPDITRLLQEARSTADLDKRAELVVEAEGLIMDDLPWIGLSLPHTVLITSAELTGATGSFVYMNAPWALTLGTVD